MSLSSLAKIKIKPKEKKEKKSVDKKEGIYTYLLDWILFLSIIVLSYYVISPFLGALLLALLTAYIVKPMVDILYKFVKSYRLSLFISILLILVPTTIFIYYASLGATPLVQGVSSLSIDFSHILQVIKAKSTHSRILTLLNVPEYIDNLQEIIQKISISLKDYLLSIVVNIPIIVIDVLIYLISTYYFVIESHKWEKYYNTIVERLSKKRRFMLNSIIKGLKNAMDVLVIAYIAMTVIITVLAYIIYVIFQVPYALLWATITGLFGLLPVLGAWMIYGGVAFYLYSIGEVTQAIILLIYGIVVVNLIPDLIIRPNLSANAGDVHPLTVILGFFGGPIVFGAIGFILGPLILVVFETVVREYYKYYIENDNV